MTKKILKELEHEMRLRQERLGDPKRSVQNQVNIGRRMEVLSLLTWIKDRKKERKKSR